jgi:hypothetical protein
MPLPFGSIPQLFLSGRGSRLVAQQTLPISTTHCTVAATFESHVQAPVTPASVDWFAAGKNGRSVELASATGCDAATAVATRRAAMMRRRAAGTMCGSFRPCFTGAAPIGRSRRFARGTLLTGTGKNYLECRPVCTEKGAVGSG